MVAMVIFQLGVAVLVRNFTCFSCVTQRQCDGFTLIDKGLACMKAKWKPNEMSFLVKD
jgi:hypothetical protein